MRPQHQPSGCSSWSRARPTPSPLQKTVKRVPSVHNASITTSDSCSQSAASVSSMTDHCKDTTCGRDAIIVLMSGNDKHVATETAIWSQDGCVL